MKICLLDFVFDGQVESRFNHFQVQGEYKNALIAATEFGLIADKLSDFQSTSITNWKPFTKARYSLSDSVYRKLNSVQKKRFSELTRYVSQGLIDEVQFVFDRKKLNSLAEYTQVIFFNSLKYSKLPDNW